MTRRVRRIGLFGGTFDPIHAGHVRAARALRRAARLNQVWVIPVNVPPHKARGPDAPAADRLRMVRLALRQDPALRPLDIEVKRRGPSYTLLTVRALQRRHPGVQFLLLLGADAARSIRRWYRYRELLARIDVIVFTRAGMPRPSRAALVRRGFLDQRLRIVEINAPPIAARALRARLRAGRSVRGFVPWRVRSYIARHGLYRAGFRRREPVG